MRPAPGAAPLDRDGERGDGELSAHMVAHRPANHLAGEEIEDHGQVEPTFTDRDVTDIGQPDLIGLVGHKILIEQVCRHGQGMLALGRARAIAAWRPSPDTTLVHTRSIRWCGPWPVARHGCAARHIVPGGEHERAGYHPEAHDRLPYAGSPVVIATRSSLIVTRSAHRT